MRLETLEAIEEAMDDFDRDIMRTLTVHAYREYTVADAEAWVEAAGGAGRQPRRDQIAIDWMVIDQSAMSYIEEYRRVLVTEGATVINGQRIPWMKDFSQGARTEVSRIIEEGIQQGLHPGVKETGVGTYPKESTAAKLKALFHDRKSHAATVARTETAHIRGLAKAARWKEREYSIVKIFDGRGSNPCGDCNQYDGQHWTVDYYQNHILQHPNCTRTASPVRPESVPAGEHVWGLGNLPVVTEAEAVG